MKFIIITSNLNLDDIVTPLVEGDNNFVHTKRFSNDIQYKDTENISDIYYIDNKTITTAIKNNSCLFAISETNLVTGITFDDFYNSNVVSMTIEEFNLISNNLLINHADEITVVWLDTKHNDKETIKKNIYEVNYLLEKLNNIKYLYFLDEETDKIINVIYEYYYADEEKRQILIEEYS